MIKFCPKANHILKADDDHFVHMPRLVDKLAKIPAESTGIVYGRLNPGSNVYRDGKCGGFQGRLSTGRISTICHRWYIRCIGLVGWLVVLRLNVPVNKFSVMSGRSHRFLGN